jgi:hypothetical protein
MTKWRVKRRSPNWGAAAASKRLRVRRMREYAALDAQLRSLAHDQPEAVAIIRTQVNRYLIDIKDARQMAQMLAAREVAAAAPILSAVPQAAIPYHKAWLQSREDLEQCQLMVEGDANLPDLMAALQNCVEWSIYWQTNERSEEAKALFAVAAEKGQDQLEEIKAMLEARA